MSIDVQAPSSSTNVVGVFRVPELRRNSLMNSSQQYKKKKTAAKNTDCPAMLVILAVHNSSASEELNALESFEAPVITIIFPATGKQTINEIGRNPSIPEGSRKAWPKGL